MSCPDVRDVSRRRGEANQVRQAALDVREIRCPTVLTRLLPLELACQSRDAIQCVLEIFGRQDPTFHFLQKGLLERGARQQHIGRADGAPTVTMPTTAVGAAAVDSKEATAPLTAAEEA